MILREGRGEVEGVEEADPLTVTPPVPVTIALGVLLGVLSVVALPLCRAEEDRDRGGEMEDWGLPEGRSLVLDPLGVTLAQDPLGVALNEAAQGERVLTPESVRELLGDTVTLLFPLPEEVAEALLDMVPASPVPLEEGVLDLEKTGTVGVGVRETVALVLPVTAPEAVPEEVGALAAVAADEGVNVPTSIPAVPVTMGVPVPLKPPIL